MTSTHNFLRDAVVVHATRVTHESAHPAGDARVLELHLPLQAPRLEMTRFPMHLANCTSNILFSWHTILYASKRCTSSGASSSSYSSPPSLASLSPGWSQNCCVLHVALAAVKTRSGCCQYAYWHLPKRELASAKTWSGQVPGGATEQVPGRVLAVVNTRTGTCQNENWRVPKHVRDKCQGARQNKRQDVFWQLPKRVLALAKTRIGKCQNVVGTSARRAP